MLLQNKGEKGEAILSFIFLAANQLRGLRFFRKNFKSISRRCYRNRGDSAFGALDRILHF